MKYKVFIDKLANNAGELETQFQQASNIIGLSHDLKSANTVFIKPNLTYPVFKKGVTTRVEFVRSLVSLLKDLNSKLTIYIGEGEGGYNSYSMTDALVNMGFTNLSQEFSDVHVINLSKYPSKEVKIKTKKGDFWVALPELLFTEVDFSISCPLPKVHAMTKVTLSLKNQWGCLSDAMRLKNHYIFDQIIAKISQELKFKYAFLDGKFGLNNNGPMVGDPLEVNWFAASNSLGAFDLVLTTMMGFNWQKIFYLKNAVKQGLAPQFDHIDIIGDMNLLKRQFKLQRDAWAYPALWAFRSKRLTHFFYISKYAKLLHDIMYMFRKKPIEL